MKKASTCLWLVVWLCVCFALLVSSAGCNAVGVRFAPTEPQKQTAELTHDLAKIIATEGTDPGSEAAVKLVQGTRAGLAYAGRPATPANADQFETIAAQAHEDAIERPDPWKVADSLLELGIGVAGVAGGAYGLKFAKYLQLARAKAKALEEVVKGNELLKKSMTTNGEKELFKKVHGQQSAETRALVTAVKTGTG